MNLSPCKFSFEDTKTRDGFTDGSTWNGWDNVWVTPEVHAAGLAEMGDHAGDDMLAMVPGDDGLICYAMGYCTTIEDATPDPMDAAAEAVDRVNMTASELHQLVNNCEEMLDELQTRMEALNNERDAWQETALGARDERNILRLELKQCRHNNERLQSKLALLLRRKS